jgi:AAA15 family ATPase/GTPase
VLSVIICSQLTRIYLDNFRSFVNFEYKPERKQLLLGPNGSGKSSLLAAVRYLKQFVKGDENRFTESTRTRWQDLSLQVFEIDSLLEGQKYEERDPDDELENLAGWYRSFSTGVP